MTNSSLRLIAYIRVSGKSQIDGFGMQIQLDMINAAADRLGATIVKVCADEGLSGTLEAVDRDGLACSIDGLREHEADGIIVANLSRLARTLTVQEAALALAWQAGGRVFTADAGEVMADDPDDPMRTAIRQVIGVMNQLDRATITLRMRKGREAKAAAGGYAGGRPGYGKVADNKALAEVPAEQRVLILMRAMRADGQSLATIANRLNEMEIKTRQGGQWRPEGVRRAVNQKG